MAPSRRVGAEPQAVEDFTRFVSAHAQALNRLAYVLTRDRFASEDLLQETLLLAFREWERVSQARDRLAYVRKVLVHVHLAGRRRRRLVMVPLSAFRGDVSTANNADYRLPDQDAVLRAIASLRPREQVALVLRFYEDLDDEAIANTLRCRRSTVRSLVHRGLKKLQTSPHLLIS